MKSTFSYIFNLIFSILLFSVTVFAGILLVENAYRVQKVNSSPSIKIKNSCYIYSHNLCKILMYWPHDSILSLSCRRSFYGNGNKENQMECNQ